MSQVKELIRRFNSQYMGILCIVMLMTSAWAKADEKLHIALGDNYGIHATKINGKPAGIQKDLLTWFLIEHMKLDVAIEAMPWKRAQQLVEQYRQSDGYFTAYTAKRVDKLKLVPSKQPFYSTKVKMHTWKNNPKIDRLKQINSRKVLIAQKDLKHVIIGGHGYHEELFKNAKNVNRVLNANQVPRYLLHYQRADLFVEQSELFYPLAKAEGLLDKVETLDNIDFKTLHWHLYIRPDSKHIGLMNAINDELSRLIKNGELQTKVRQIFIKYGLRYAAEAASN